MKLISIILILVAFYFIRRDYLYFTFERGYSEEMYNLKEKIRKHPVAIVDGVSNPKFPDSDENHTTYEGIDSNNNKIRDDVELWINYNARDINERMAMRQMANAYNLTNLEERAPKEDPEKKEYYIRKYQETNNSYDCLFNICRYVDKKFKLNGDCIEIGSRLSRVMANNRYRRFKLELVFKLGDSTTHEVADLSTCKFQIQK